MTKEELKKYARENRKRLDAQEVKLGDVVKLLVGPFAGETGIVVGISACCNDYTDPYYEVDMNCEVPEKYKCRKTLITPNNVVGGLNAHDFEVIGNRAPKQPSMEIKQGDKVRVSSRLPRIYERFGSRIAPHYECKVVEIDDGMALLDSIPAKHIFLFPLKYLVKVNTEAKAATAPTIKVGDRVCCYNVLHLKCSKKEDYMGVVTSITDMGITVQLDNGGTMLSYRESDLELVQPTEQTEASADVLGEFTPIPRFYNPIIGFKQAYWQEYEADLAKEIALKVANKKMDNRPEDIGAYAVQVAKAVVEGLKRK